MTDETTTTATHSGTHAEDSTWLASVQAFEAEAKDWLTDADAPQLMALRALAKALDSGTFQAALISQFTLVHRGLLARRPGGTPTATAESGAKREPTMFELMGGVWQGDGIDA